MKLDTMQSPTCRIPKFNRNVGRENLGEYSNEHSFELMLTVPMSAGLGALYSETSPIVRFCACRISVFSSRRRSRTIIQYCNQRQSIASTPCDNNVQFENKETLWPASPGIMGEAHNSLINRKLPSKDRALGSRITRINEELPFS